jgi:hypothetical protein
MSTGAFAANGTTQSVTAQAAFEKANSAETKNVGENVTFTVDAADQMQDVVLQWQKDGADVSGATTKVLTLNNLTADNAGTYVLVATDADDNATFKTGNFVLTVNTAAAPAAASPNPVATSTPQATTTSTTADYASIIQSAKDSITMLGKKVAATTTKAAELETALVLPREQLALINTLAAAEADTTLKGNLLVAATDLSKAITDAETQATKLARQEAGFVNLEYAVNNTAVWDEPIPLIDTTNRAFDKLFDSADAMIWNRVRVTPFGYGSQDNHYPAWMVLSKLTASRPLDQNTAWTISNENGQGNLTSLYGTFYDQWKKNGTAPKSKDLVMSEEPEAYFKNPWMLEVKPKAEPFDLAWTVTLDPYTQGDAWKTYTSFGQNPYNPGDNHSDKIATDPYRRALSDKAMANPKARVGLFLSGNVGSVANITLHNQDGSVAYKRAIPLSPLQYQGGGSTHLTADDQTKVLYINHDKLAEWGAEAWEYPEIAKEQPGSHLNQIIVIEPDFNGFITVEVDGVQVGNQLNFWFGDVILP